MKKSLFTAAVLAAFAFSACSERAANTNDTATAAITEQQNEAAQVVVETPDYSAVAEPIKTQTSQLVDAYLEVKEALVKADANAARESAKAILAVAEAMPVATLTTAEKAFAEEQVAAVKESAAKIAESSEVAAQRESLEPLSKATFSMAKAFKANDNKLYYQFCPMANNSEGAYWISNTEEIRNPYMGESMLGCGSNEEVLD